MHFEVSRQLAQQWISGGVPSIGTGPSAPPSSDPSDGQGGQLPSGPQCTYRGNRGACISTASCSGSRGQSFSSRIGANGCQSYPADIKCCIAGSSLLEGETGDETPQDFEIEDDPDAPALEDGEIAGIVIGVLILVLVVGAVVFFVRAKRNASAAAAQVDAAYAGGERDRYMSAIDVVPVAPRSDTTFAAAAQGGFVGSFESTRSPTLSGGQYACSQCAAAFADTDSLLAHVSAAHSV